MSGAQLPNLARSGGEAVVALGFGASTWLVAGRDRFIGWSDARKAKGSGAEMSADADGELALPEPGLPGLK